MKETQKELYTNGWLRYSKAALYLRKIEGSPLFWTCEIQGA